MVQQLLLLLQNSSFGKQHGLEEWEQWQKLRGVQFLETESMF